MNDQRKSTVIAVGDIMTLDTKVAAFVLLVEGPEDNSRHPKYGARVFFRWLAHLEVSKETTRDWMWESTLRDAAWLKVA